MIEINVSFETYKVLTSLRANESTTYDDVIRDLLKLPSEPKNTDHAALRKGWTYKGVTLPHGTDLRANYKGETYTAKIEDDKWMQDGTPQSSPVRIRLQER